MDSRSIFLAWTFIAGIACAATAANHVHKAMETEMFSIPISPNLFNWTYQEFDQQYRFHASLLHKPELPTWLRYIYSARHHSGFIFGTPPRGTKSPLTLEVIGLNRQDYETRRVELTLTVDKKPAMAKHEVEIKIDNLNVEDLLDEHRMTHLKDILRTKLWVESSHDLYTTFLASAVDMGARLPLRPEDGEGLVVRFGSTTPFSKELKNLREEVRPLSKLPSCPREYKRTTVERLFRDAQFTLDWCSFELYNTIYKDRSTDHIEYLTEIPNPSKIPNSLKAMDGHIWTAPARASLPSRSYTKQLTIAVAAPLVLLLISIAALTAVMCFHYATIAHKSSKVEMCKYGNENTEQTQIIDDNSDRSMGISPNNSLARPYSPKSTTNLAGSYNRPQPPPYMGSTTNSLHHRKSGNTDRNTPSTSGHTPEHRNLALEDSLKLLNEANIQKNELDGIPLKEPIIDLADGLEDYVAIKPTMSGYISMKCNLDDIDVPEFNNYCLGAI